VNEVLFGPAARALFDLAGPTAVSAGAGSGKTTALVELVVRLLDGRATGTACAPAELAAITFTDKAGEELRARVRAAVAERVRAAKGSEERRAWLSRLRSLDGLTAGTIHGFCGRILREHAPEAGLDPDFEVADEDRAAPWLQAAAREAVVAALDRGQPEARALSAAVGTRGLSLWVAALVRERATRGDLGPVEVAPGDPSAAAEARRQLLEAARALVVAAGASGAPALAERVEAALEGLRPGDLEGVPGAPALARLEALGEAVRQGRGGARALSGATAAVRRAVEQVRAEAADLLGAPQRQALASLVEEAARRYAVRKAAERAVDFDDLLLLARSLLRRDVALRAELRRGLKALLVDEYQDVNPVQQSIFEILCGGHPGEGSRPTLVAVGDRKQSIYRFRGADVAVFARLLRAFEAGEGRVLHLSENHRSSPGVLEAVNAVSARALQPPPGQPPRDDEIAFGEADRLEARRPEGARPACELLEDAAGGSAAERRLREARGIAARIRQVLSGEAGIAVRERGEGGPERARTPRPGEVAVLFRRLTQLGPYERALREAGIPFRLARGGGFYQASEVRDVGELLAALADPEDAVAWAALLRSPACAVGDGTLLLLSRLGLSRLHRLAAADLRAALGAAAGAEALAAVPEAELHRAERLLRLHQELLALRDRIPLPELLGRAVDRLDLDAALLAGPEGERRAANLDKVQVLAARFARRGGTAAELAAHLRAMAARPPREPEAELEAGDAVALLSVHQAKGLEWPVVFLPDLGAEPPAEARSALLDRAGRLCSAFLDPARGEFLRGRSLDDARADLKRAQSAESRRLLYVALTRARDHLVLSGEVGRGECWRGLVEEALAGRPDLLRRLPLPSAAEPPGPAAVPAPPAAPPAAPELPAPPAPPAVRLAVTDLAEYARCPRRHLLGRVLGLSEPAAQGAPPGDDPARATARGTLAHGMLAEADLAAPPLERRAQLLAAASRRGYDPQSPGVRRILAEVTRFTESAGGRRLCRAADEGRLRREVPFLLRLEAPGGAAYLVGAIDALVSGPEGELLVVDYKYATPRPEAAARYRLQLAVYTLAVARSHPGARVQAALQFLRGDHRLLDLTPTAAELASLAAAAPGWARAAATPRAVDPAELGRDVRRCRAEGCGFVARCFAGARAG